MSASAQAMTSALQIAYPNLLQVTKDVTAANCLAAEHSKTGSMNSDTVAELADCYGVATAERGSWETLRNVGVELRRALVARVHEMTPEFAERHRGELDRMIAGEDGKYSTERLINGREKYLVEEALAVFFPGEHCYWHNGYHPGPANLSQQVFLLGAYFGRVPRQWKSVVPEFMKMLDPFGRGTARRYRSVVKDSIWEVGHVLGTSFGVLKDGIYGLEKKDLRRLGSLRRLFAKYPHIPSDTSRRWKFIRQHVTHRGRLRREFGITPAFLEGAQKLGFIRD